MPLAYRPVASLTFAEIFLVWAVRQPTSAYAGGHPPLHREFANAFGPETGETMVAAVTRILQNLGTHREGIGGGEDSRTTALEELLLSALVLAHDNRGAALASLLRRLLPLRAARDSGRALFALAQAFTAAGHVLPRHGMAPPAQQIVAARSALPAPGRSSKDLPFGARLLLCALRVWVNAARQRRDPADALLRFLFDNDSAALAPELDSLLALLIGSAPRPITVHAPACGGLSDDERTFLEAVAGLQRHDTAPAAAPVGGWLAHAGVPGVQDALGKVARTLLRLGHALNRTEAAVGKRGERAKREIPGQARSALLH